MFIRYQSYNNNWFTTISRLCGSQARQTASSSLHQQMAPSCGGTSGEETNIAPTVMCHTNIAIHIWLTQILLPQILLPLSRAIQILLSQLLLPQILLPLSCGGTSGEETNIAAPRSRNTFYCIREAIFWRKDLIHRLPKSL